MSLQSTTMSDGLYTESQSDRLARKSKQFPVFPLAIAGCAGMVGYGIYHYKNRGQMSTSLYLVRFRVIAQGTAVGILTLGLGYSMINDFLNRNKNKSISES